MTGCADESWDDCAGWSWDADWQLNWYDGHFCTWGDLQFRYDAHFLGVPARVNYPHYVGYPRDPPRAVWNPPAAPLPGILVAVWNLCPTLTSAAIQREIEELDLNPVLVRICPQVAGSCFVLCSEDWVANVVAIILNRSDDILEPIDGKFVRAASVVQSTDGAQLDMPEELSQAFLAEVMHMQATLPLATSSTVAEVLTTASSSTSYRIRRR